MGIMADSARISLASEPLALGALDGRYRAAVAPLVDHLSEAALNRDRVHVEVEWLIHLTDNSVLPGTSPLSEDQRAALRAIVTGFDAASVTELAEIEAVTVHDVKAVEYYIARRLEAIGIENLTAMVHFGCTSEDINNLAYALGVKDAVMNVWLPAARALVAQITAMAEESRDVPMLSRTHGQPATPTTLGKELAVLAWRLTRQLDRIEKTEFLGKINGATGTYAAHYASVPTADWQEVSRTFVEGLGLTWNPLTTQIESHDWQAELYADMARFNRVLHNLCTDVWSYISIGYFAQIPVAGATGSSTMPHKVNPIDFENAEGNFGIANALFEHFSAKLPISRWQRDLTDSTVLRALGTAFGHTQVALDSLAKGLGKLEVNPQRLDADLDAAWEVLAEAVQTVMRRHGLPNPYEQLKALTRGQGITADSMRAFIESLDLPADAKQRLRDMTPGSYTGLAERLARGI